MKTEPLAVSQAFLSTKHIIGAFPPRCNRNNGAGRANTLRDWPGSFLVDKQKDPPLMLPI